MLKKFVVLAVLLSMIFATAGCYTHIHKVGSGAQGNDVQLERQWYVLFGLIPLNDVDTNAMAGDATNYEITTSSTFLDMVIGFFTGIVTVAPKTVKVQK
ncbi:MAG: hypothetical protein B6244_12355 [Candidatus Cloacimonetes bacterium 4572_55]|nr:MAG: hypothetical protein B6244_12355 [Candidatus Cloacimonetes bacterium 4572_55]